MIPIYDPYKIRIRLRQPSAAALLALYLYMMFVLIVVVGAFIAVLQPAIQILPDTR